MGKKKKLLHELILEELGQRATNIKAFQNGSRRNPFARCLGIEIEINSFERDASLFVRMRPLAPKDRALIRQEARRLREALCTGTLAGPAKHRIQKSLSAVLRANGARGGK